MSTTTKFFRPSPQGGKAQQFRLIVLKVAGEAANNAAPKRIERVSGRGKHAEAFLENGLTQLGQSPNVSPEIVIY